MQHERIESQPLNHRLEVQHPLLQREVGDVAVREPRPARVELDDSPVLGQLVEELAPLAPFELAVTNGRLGTRMIVGELFPAVPNAIRTPSAAVAYCIRSSMPLG